MKQKTVLLTGSTGAFGRFLARKFLEDDNIRLILLVRANSQEEAMVRVQNIIGEKHKKVKVFCSDLIKDQLGLSESEITYLTTNVTHILHSAASVRFTLPIEEARLYNVKTVERMLHLAEKCQNIVRFGFVGTALVAGNRSGVIKEGEFEHNAGFKNTYEQSKHEAEKLVQSYIDKLPIVIFRPPLVAPSISNNDTNRGHRNALLLGASLVAGKDVNFLPGTEDSPIDIVDPKIAADRIIKLFLKPTLAYTVYHITNGKYAPTIRTIHKMIEEKLNRVLPMDFCGSTVEYDKRVSQIPWYKIRARYAHKKIRSFISELAYPKIYDNSRTLTELQISQLGSDPINMLNKLLK